MFQTTHFEWVMVTMVRHICLRLPCIFYDKESPQSSHFSFSSFVILSLLAKNCNSTVRDFPCPRPAKHQITLSLKLYTNVGNAHFENLDEFAKEFNFFDLEFPRGRRRPIIWTKCLPKLHESSRNWSLVPPICYRFYTGKANIFQYVKESLPNLAWNFPGPSSFQYNSGS